MVQSDEVKNYEQDFLSYIIAFYNLHYREYNIAKSDPISKIDLDELAAILSRRNEERPGNVFGQLNFSITECILRNGLYSAVQKISEEELSNYDSKIYKVIDSYLHTLLNNQMDSYIGERQSGNSPDTSWLRVSHRLMPVINVAAQESFSGHTSLLDEIIELCKPIDEPDQLAHKKFIVHLYQRPYNKLN